MDDINRDAFLPVVPGAAEPDAHGQAALLLVESMLHALVEARVFTLGAALEVVETTCEVKMEVAELAGESKARMQESLDLLNAIYVSLAADAQ
ncbi:hypothetical protein [Sphingomonas qomolangmaensis]|uniref:Uncharacterized protein n=1 Tax=Sphingomonas qomolangmaensis TaxID=2918765 RepID=A0ABY5LB58_9SPHN|nr:hypothetical protein [Sphingomonas qomolangmaensis]UUL83258.1 hypothetical protein NMP03_03230 [Sphingomonas qomolangmaensis]